eukprot:2928290-Pleurochrysis_carterae.AAC.1
MARAGVAIRADVVAATAALPAGAMLACNGSTEGATALSRRRGMQQERYAAAAEGTSYAVTYTKSWTAASYSRRHRTPVSNEFVVCTTAR